MYVYKSKPSRCSSWERRLVIHEFNLSVSKFQAVSTSSGIVRQARFILDQYIFLFRSYARKDSGVNQSHPIRQKQIAANGSIIQERDLTCECLWTRLANQSRPISVYIFNEFSPILCTLLLGGRIFHHDSRTRSSKSSRSSSKPSKVEQLCIAPVCWRATK